MGGRPCAGLADAASAVPARPRIPRSRAVCRCGYSAATRPHPEPNPLAEKLPPLWRRPSLPPAVHMQHGIGISQPAVRRGARPWPLLRRLRHARPHRIQLHIAQRLPQMRLLQWTGVEPSLPHTPARRLLRVPVGGIASVGLLEALRQGDRRMWDRDQMHMI